MYLYFARYFNRDVDCIRVFFSKKFGFESSDYPRFKDCVKTHDLDVEISASGFTKEQQDEFEEVCLSVAFVF